MRKVFNFSAGPAVLPEEVLAQAAAEMSNWNDSGQSVMEMSHRGKEYMSIHERAEKDLRALMDIPDSHAVLFLQGGATLQFAMVPLNLLGQNGYGAFVNTGEWSKKAIKEARRFGEVDVVASAEDRKFTYVPPQSSWKEFDGAAYLHYCANETIGGVEFGFTPDSGDVPLVADISSNFLSRPMDVASHAILYGGAQKNIGPAGLTIVIMRRDLIGRARMDTPTMLDYQVHADANSMLNTPPTWAIYMAGLVFQWLQRQGGVAAIEQRNIEKANLLYDYLDSTPFYTNPVEPADRSRMNVPFRLPDPALDEPFLEGAKERGLLQLKGHRSVGGMRASIYNAMPIDGVRALLDWMREFEKEHG